MVCTTLASTGHGPGFYCRECSAAFQAEINDKAATRAEDNRKLAERACWALLQDDIISFDMVGDLDPHIERAVEIATRTKNCAQAIDAGANANWEHMKRKPPEPSSPIDDLIDGAKMIGIALTKKTAPSASVARVMNYRQEGSYLDIVSNGPPRDPCLASLTPEMRRIVEHCAALADEHRSGSEIRRLVLGQPPEQNEPEWPDEVL